MAKHMPRQQALDDIKRFAAYAAKLGFLPNIKHARLESPSRRIEFTGKHWRVVAVRLMECRKIGASSDLRRAIGLAGYKL